MPYTSFLHSTFVCMQWVLHSDGSGARNRIFGYLESAKKWVYAQIEQGISSFIANFLAYLIIFQSFVVPSAHAILKNHQILCQKFSKK